MENRALPNGCFLDDTRVTSEDENSRPQHNTFYLVHSFSWLGCLPVTEEIHGSESRMHRKTNVGVAERFSGGLKPHDNGGSIPSSHTKQAKVNFRML